jgi:hypothetical protein
MANPVTAPYRFAVTPKGRRYILSGRVGTKQVHDVAIQTALALGVAVVDDLTIDTAEAHRAAAIRAAGLAPGVTLPPGTLPYYVYPQPLMGRLDNPFYGMEPPLLAYPPWWGPAVGQAGAAASVVPTATAPAATVTSTPASGPTAGGTASPTDGLPGTVEMTLDPRGVAVLRGSVPTLADRVAVGQQIARTPGITEVINLLNVGSIAPAASPSTSDVPPPPPQPASRPNSSAPATPRPDAAAEAASAPIALDADDLSRRVADTLGRRPALAGQPIRVITGDGVATLNGHVPTAFEAMTAFRAAQQTPGVRDVIDRLEFEPPDGDKPNPLREKGRPEDVAPYLLAHVRRQVGDLAHVDRVEVRGDTVEVRGTVARPDDTARVEATLRLIPLLRGFRVEPEFFVD